MWSSLFIKDIKSIYIEPKPKTFAFNEINDVIENANWISSNLMLSYFHVSWIISRMFLTSDTN